MYSLAASAMMLVAVAGQSAPLTLKEKVVWRQLQPSIVMILRAGNPVGAAALIDESGLFVAHRSSVTGNAVDARLIDGRTIRLRLRNADGTTQLALLRIVGTMPEGLKALSSPGGSLASGKPLFAVLPTGPVRASFISGNQYGRFGPGLRVLPVSEIRFESTPEVIGGALLVSYEGEFMGALNATLPRKLEDGMMYQQNMSRLAPENGLGRGGVGGGGASMRTIPNQLNQMGPAEMTVAYSIGTEVVKRVLDGYRSPEHEVSYPTLGVFCRDGLDGGALIIRVVPGSGADQAKLRPGDVILGIGSTTIRNQIDFSRVMFDQKVGTTTKIRFRRGAMQYIQEVPVGKQAG